MEVRLAGGEASIVFFNRGRGLCLTCIWEEHFQLLSVVGHMSQVLEPPFYLKFGLF